GRSSLLTLLNRVRMAPLGCRHVTRSHAGRRQVSLERGTCSATQLPYGYALPAGAHRVRQVRRLGIPASAPRIDTHSVSASTIKVTHEPTVAPCCTAAAAFSACCCARSLYWARKVRTSAATRSGLSRTVSTRARNWARAVWASVVGMPVTEANRETVCGS